MILRRFLERLAVADEQHPASFQTGSSAVSFATRDARELLRVRADSSRVASRTLCDPTAQIRARRTRHRGCTGGR